MSAYQKKAPWDRNNKYWCEYCRIFVFDNRSHESGTKHKDNVQKFLRNIGKNAEAKAQAEKQLNAQLAKIDEAAAQSYRADTGSVATEGASVAAVKDTMLKGTKAARRKEAPSERIDESEAALKQDNRPADVGIIGEWEVVETGDGFPNSEGGGEGAAAAGSEDPPQNPLELRGAELLDEEDHHPGQLADFDIKEKTAATLPDPADDTDDPAPVVFKKRRALTNRATRKQRKL
ncbi:hypothetical protein GGF43_003963 [Coemansia sp. RSA 2618]|nr:hypothetical protein GGF43_003963 [Coemansia sp. RSA 2618]